MTTFALVSTAPYLSFSMNSVTTLPAQTENSTLKYVFPLQKAHKEIYNVRFTAIYLYKFYFLYFDKNSLLIVYVQYTLYSVSISIFNSFNLKTYDTVKKKECGHENHMSNSKNRTYLSMYLHEN
jgi:hypothetical protein